MKAIIFVILGILILPGSVIMLLASNFGALKGYLIGALSFFGFLVILSTIWTFGLPGTPALTGPKGVDPTFKPFSPTAALGSKYDKVRQFQGTASNGWTAEPTSPPGVQLTGADALRRADLEAAKQKVLTDFILRKNAGVTDSSNEVDVTNLDTAVYYAEQKGTEVAAIVISPGTPPAGTGLSRPSFAPVTVFAYRDPGAPKLPSYVFLAVSILLFALHVFLLGIVERRRPLGWAPVPRVPADSPARV